MKHSDEIKIEKNFSAVFIDLGKGSTSGAKLTFTFGAGTSVTDRLFEIRVTQLYCDNPSR